MPNLSLMGIVSQLILAIALVSCADSKTNTPPASAAEQTASKGQLNMEVVVQNASNDKAKLLGVFGNQNFVVDSALGDANGTFVFKADTLLPAGFYYFMLGSDNSYFQLLLGADQEFTLNTTKGAYVPTMQVEGSLDNELLYKNLKFEADFTQRLQPVNNQLAALTPGTPAHTEVKEKQEALIEERKAHVQWFADNHPQSLFTQFKLSGQNPELTYPTLPNGELDQAAQVYHYRNAFFDNVDFNAAWTMRTPVFANKLRKYIRELTPQNADSLIKYTDLLVAKTMSNKELFKFVVNWIALEYKTPKTMGTEALYVHMIDTYWKPELAFWSNQEEIKGLQREVGFMRPSLIGKTAQDIVVQNQEGKPVSLYGITAPIKVLFIYSYECEHCQKEAPEMVKVYNQWKDRGLDVLALSTDKDKAKWNAFIRQHNMTFTNAIDPDRKSRYDHKYHIDITPELYVLDKNNTIIASNLSPAQLPAFLEAERARNPW